uniref:Uncharacterized protein n=1 Tax=Strigamia maritima TaxID=126957 RepID=T1IXM9_STRMM
MPGLVCLDQYAWPAELAEPAGYTRISMPDQGKIKQDLDIADETKKKVEPLSLEELIAKKKAEEDARNKMIYMIS